MAVQKITQAEFDDVVLKSDVPVLVDFFAEWCGPCKMMEPILEQASEEVSGAKIVAVDADESLAPRLVESAPCSKPMSRALMTAMRGIPHQPSVPMVLAEPLAIPAVTSAVVWAAVSASLARFIACCIIRFCAY